MPEQQHFSDYGFDPYINYFQVLEEARKHKRENPTRSIDSLHFKLQKPISEDRKDSGKNKIKKMSRNRWWKSALHFFRGKLGRQKNRPNSDHHVGVVHPIRHAVSGPVYISESRSGSATPPFRTIGRPSSGPLAPTIKGEMDIPYISLAEDQARRISPTPIYLVT